MSDNGILIDRSKHKNTTWYAEDDDGICTGPYASKELANEALDRYHQVVELHLLVRELSDLYERWERGEAVESEILEYATTKQAPGWPVIVF